MIAYQFFYPKIARTLGSVGLFAILLHIKGPLIPFIVVAAICGALLRTRSSAS